VLALVGIILAVGLVTDASFFSTAVDRVILLQELKDFSAGTAAHPSLPRCITSHPTGCPCRSKPPKSSPLPLPGILTSQVGLPLRFQRLQSPAAG